MDRVYIVKSIGGSGGVFGVFKDKINAEKEAVRRNNELAGAGVPLFFFVSPHNIQDQESFNKDYYISELERCIRNMLDAFWDMSPLEYAQSRGLPHMSDSIGEQILEDARKLIGRE